MAVVAKRFRAVRPGDVHPTWVEAGERVDGRLEEIARQLGALETKARKAAPENKAR